MRKPKKVDVFVHKESKAEVDIRLDVKTGTFSAEVGGNKLESKDLDKLKKTIAELLSKSAAIKWVPVIYFRMNSYSSLNAPDVDIRADRFYAGKVPGGSFLRAAWKTSGRARLDEATSSTVDLEHLPHCPKRHGSITEGYFPYTEDLWVAIHNFCEAIVVIKKVMLASLVSDDIAGTLAKCANPILDLWPQFRPQEVEVE